LHLHACVLIICTVFTFLPPFPNTSSSHWCQPFPLEQDLFCPLVLQFCRRKNRKDQMKNMKF
jgi:hypothetical protein